MSKLLKSIAGFQQKCPVIHQNSEGYGYKYADLATILEVINPILAEFNLGFYQYIDDNHVGTVIFHTETADQLERKTKIPETQLKGMNTFQVMGSAITYMRRYQLSAMLGIVTDDDNDANQPKTDDKPPKSNPKPPKPQKAKLPNERFEKALEGLKTGNTSVEQITRFDLTPEQQKKLNETLKK